MSTVETIVHPDPEALAASVAARLITAIIDAHGRVAAVAPFLTADVLDGAVQGRAGNTPFLLAGNLAALGLIVLLLLAALWSSRCPGSRCQGSRRRGSRRAVTP